LRAAKLPGRTQWIEGPGRLPLVLDGAHNPTGVGALCAHLRKSGPGRPRIFFAMMRDKDFLSVYRCLRELSSDIVHLDLTRSFSRALAAADLREALSPEERDGLREASMDWPSLDPLLRPGSGAGYGVVCGSLYLLGEIIPLLLPHYRGLEEFAKLLEEEPPS
jgi:dihydrofolate synthase/folylpolyglutamate synthase